MPKTSTENLQTLLAPYGLRLTLADGKLSILEGVSALPAKTVTLAFVAKMKPDGSVGRGAPEGYNLQDAMELSNEHYKVLQDIAHLILQRTHSINTNKPISNQPPGSIDLCIKKLLKIHPELHAYKPFGYWALRATFQLLLRNKSGQANTLARELKKIRMVVESGGELPKPATKPRRQRGRPRKNPTPAPEDTDTTTNKPIAQVQPPLAPASGSNTAAPHDDSGEVFDILVEDEIVMS